MVSWSERMISHTGIDIWFRFPTGGSSEEFCAMGETLTQQRRVSDEGFRVVKLCQVGRTHMVLIFPYVDGTTEGSTG